MWGGHSCPPPLTLLNDYSNLAAPALQFFKIKINNSVKSKVNCNRDGQEFPPRTYAIEVFSLKKYLVKACPV
jgi:hypothetical protein